MSVRARRRLLEAGCALAAAAIAAWLLARPAVSRGTLVPVGGGDNACRCTQRIEP